MVSDPLVTVSVTVNVWDAASPSVTVYWWENGAVFAPTFWSLPLITGFVL